MTSQKTSPIYPTCALRLSLASPNMSVLQAPRPTTPPKLARCNTTCRQEGEEGW